MSIHFSRIVYLHLRKIRAKTIKCEAVTCIQMFAEKKAMVLHYQRDQWSLGTTIYKDFPFLISGYLIYCNDQVLLKCYLSEFRPQLWHQLQCEPLQNIFWKSINKHSSEKWISKVPKYHGPNLLAIIPNCILIATQLFARINKHLYKQTVLVLISQHYPISCFRCRFKFISSNRH